MSALLLSSEKRMVSRAECGNGTIPQGGPPHVSGVHYFKRIGQLDGVSVWEIQIPSCLCSAGLAEVQSNFGNCRKKLCGACGRWRKKLELVAFSGCCDLDSNCLLGMPGSRSSEFVLFDLDFLTCSLDHEIDQRSSSPLPEIRKCHAKHLFEPTRSCNGHILIQ